jgi:hypothetical protein
MHTHFHLHTETMRQQAEAHMAEMAKVREQVAKLRETSKNGNFFKKTVRGGGSKF